MHDLPAPIAGRRPRPVRSILLSLIALAAVVAACSSAGASVSAPASSAPIASAPAGDTPTSGAPSADPSVGMPGDGPQIVVPWPGQLDVHPVGAETFSAVVDDARHIQLTIDWWSGVEPCTILDSIVVERGTPVITVTLREGRGPGDVVCIEIAEQHRTVVDLGEYAPGTYTIQDGAGAAPPIEVTVS